MDGKTCQYLKSRRGLRNKSNLVDDQTSPVPRSEFNDNVSPQTVFPNTTTPKSGSESIASSTRPITPLSQELCNMAAPRIITPLSVLYQIPDVTHKITSRFPDSETNIGLYYKFFHPAHPWVVPRARMNRLMVSHGTQIQDLLTVMEFIGSTYTPGGQSQNLRRRATGAVFRPNLQRNAFTVQALLVMAVGVHCCSDFKEARAILDKAISIALEIGMESRAFASANGDGDNVLEESWRRTWWGVFVVDGCFEAIHRSYTFRTWHVQSDVDIPCEESDYASEVSFFQDLSTVLHQLTVIRIFLYLIHLQNTTREILLKRKLYFHHLHI